MSFGDAIGECFFNYANFRDRAARAEYWWWLLFVTIVLAVAVVLDLALFSGFSVPPFLTLIIFASILPGLSVTVRRLHDTGHSGWWLLIPVGAGLLAMAITIVGVITHGNEPPSTPLLIFIGVPMIVCMGTSILLLVWMAVPSIPGNNAYGPNRYAGS